MVQLRQPLDALDILILPPSFAKLAIVRISTHMVSHSPILYQQQLIIAFQQFCMISHNIPWYSYLVGGSATPLKNMSSSIGMISNPIDGKIKNGNQTTNQLLLAA